MAATKKGSTGAGKAGGPAAAKAGGAKRAGAAAGAGAKAAKAGAKGSDGAARKAAPVRVTDKQREMLQKIQGAGESGFDVAQKADQRVVDALVEKKLVKKTAKDKATGRVRYLLTKAGQKHSAPAATGA